MKTFPLYLLLIAMLGCGSGTEPAETPVADTVVEPDSKPITPLLTLNEHPPAVLSVTFSPNGKRIASTSYDELVRIWDSETGVQKLTTAPKPRGDVRIVYASDHANIPNYILTDNPTAAELRRVVDTLVASGVDIFAQCVFQKQGVGWFWPEHPGHEHFESGVDKIDRKEGLPIEIAIDQCHKRGIKFVAKFRMADRHPHGAAGLARKKEFWIPDVSDQGMDYTHPEVRDWMFGLLEEILRRFDVDGFEFNYIRWMHTFPRATARESHPIMTGFLRRVRQKLNEESKRKGRKLLLGVRVPQTLKECDALGYDVATWVKQGLIDYLAPSDFNLTDFNAKYEEFAALTRQSDCMLFPTVNPRTFRMNSDRLMSKENYRAVSKNLYAAGADGISTFNYMYHWVGRSLAFGPDSRPSGYPLALAWLRQLRDPDRLADHPRHYLFYPLWAGHWKGVCPSGAPGGSDPIFIKNDRIVLEHKIGSTGEYRFRIAEDLSPPGVRGEMIITLGGIVGADLDCPPRLQRDGSFLPPAKDKIELSINGTVIPPESIKVSWPSRGRPKEYGRPFDTCSIFMFSLRSPPVVFGDNILGAKVIALDEDGKGNIIIDELEVTVVSPPKVAKE